MKLLTQAVLTYLLNASWQVALVVAFAVFADWLLRGIAARYRYALWIVTLLVCATIPLSSLSSLRKLNAAPPAVYARTASGPVVTTRILTPGVEIADGTSDDPLASPQRTVARRSILSASSLNVPTRLAFVILAIYLAFLLGKFLLFLRAWGRTQTIVRGATDSAPPDHLQAIVDRCSRLIGVKRARVVHSREVPVPITLGVINPIIVLPEDLLQETDRDLLSSAIGHELVHVARRDYLWNLVFETIYLPLSFHPAAALVRRRIRQTRELCCDEIVAMKLLKAETYAHSLMRLIGSAPLSPRLISDTAIGLNQSDILEVRIMSLLNSKKRKAGSPKALLIAAALVLLAPCVLSSRLALKLDVYAQERTQSVQEKEAKQELEKSLQGLRQQASDLNEKLKGADEAQRKEIEARLTEVKRNLEEHERAAAEFRYQQEESSQRLRALLDEYESTKTVDREQLKKAEVELARIESEYPRNDALLREVREKLALLEGAAGQNRKARVVYRVEPEYTQDAREKHITGSVVLGITVGHDGSLQSVQVKKSLYPSLDESSIAAVRKWRFEPAIKDGQPVSMYLAVEFIFSGDRIEIAPAREKEERERAETARGYAESNGEVLSVRRSKEREEEQGDRERRQSELTRDAVVPMDRAIQIATSQVPGKVLACSLGREGDSIFYHVVIVSSEDGQTAATYVWVSATDGHVIKTEKEKRRAIQGGVLNGKATSLPNPEYPAIARAAKASGTVTVEVIVDEEGNVVAAKAVSGHPLLQSAAVSAARQAKFTPTRVNGEPTRISGYLTYNFVAQ